MKKNSLIILLVTLLMLMPGYASAQEITVDVLDQEVSSQFRDNVTFTMTAESTAEIMDVDLLYQIDGQVAASRNQADFVPGTTINAEFVLDQTEPGNYFPPGTELQYWWKLTDAGSNVVATEKQPLLYMDETHTWQTLSNERLTLYWYEGDAEFSEGIFDRANESLDTLEEDMAVMLEEPIKIFIYADHTDFMDAYFPSGQEWAGGAAFDENDVVMMTVEPDQPEWGTLITTHEMTHLVVHQATDNFFTGDLTLPRWLDEGIAVYTSGEIHIRPDFQRELRQAIEDDELFTLQTLSSPFSSDPEEAVLSYAQSGAVVDFIVETYGPEAIADLLDALAEGLLYDEALEQAIGLDTVGLDNAFRESVDLPPLPPLSEVAPEQVEESNDEAESSEPAAGSADEMEQPAAAEEVNESQETKADEAPSPQDAEETDEEIAPPVGTTEEESSNPLAAVCCLAGMIPLVLAGVGFYSLRFMG